MYEHKINGIFTRAPSAPRGDASARLEATLDEFQPGRSTATQLQHHQQRLASALLAPVAVDGALRDRTGG